MEKRFGLYGKIVSVIMLSLLVTGTLALAVYVHPVRADLGTIYIKADGNIEPPAAPLITADNITYTLTDNVTSNADGIVIERDNVILDGAGYTVMGSGSGNGATLSDRSNVTIRNMTIKNFGFGIWLSSSSNNTLSGNDVTTNEGTGIWLNSSSNNSMSGNNLTANSYYGIWLYSSSNNNISGNDMTNNIDGILLWSSSNNNSISENNLAGNYYGIDVDSSSNNGISGNNIANNSYGIWLESSSGNGISANNITANNVDGMWVDSSSDNSISGNNVTANGDCGIWVDSSSNNGISGNVITNSSVGISLDSSSSNSISGNNIANNSYGIWLYSSFNNSMSGNNITNNFYGIYFAFSTGNKVYNSYINNQFQVSSYQSTNVWDNGYPSGGNYWSDYGGTDLYSGPQQNQSASDGIGDTPYVIDADNLDNYPLMNPWSPPDIAVTNLTSAKTVIGQGYTGTVNVTFENLGNKIETFNATVYANSTYVQSEQPMLAITNCTLSFSWNTTGFTYGNYTISAYASPLQGETSTANNNLMGGMVYVGIPGDINGDETVNKLDATALSDAFLATLGNSNWNPNADINGDNIVNILDAIILSNHYLQHYP